MSLGKTQKQFTECVGKLITYAYAQGYELTEGDAFRDTRVHGEFGEKKSYAAAYSVHKVKLAQDFNLFVEDKYITDSHHPAFVDLGEYWESLHPLARWGGRFNDGNHFSFEYQGRK